MKTRTTLLSTAYGRAKKLSGDVLTQKTLRWRTGLPERTFRRWKNEYCLTLKEFRTNLQLPQYDTGYILNISERTIRRWENGK